MLTSNLSKRALTLGALAGLTLLAAGCSGGGGSTDKVTSDDMILGDPNAPVTVVEYASVACPICAVVNQEIMPEFKKKYVETGKVKLVYRPMLTGNPQVAAAGHMLANCVAKDKQFGVLDSIMRAQGRMDQGGAPEQYVNARPVLIGIAQSAGLSEDQFNTCITDKKSLEKQNDLNELYGSKHGITGTPTFFVNGKKMTFVKRDITDFDAAIQPLLKK
jgi:protein-disulfide isomerase